MPLNKWHSIPFTDLSFMKTRKLGHTNIQVAPLMLGGNVFGWTIDAATSFTILDAFTDAGFNFIDTADVYSRWKPGNRGGESEYIIGQWFARSGKRDKIILATKVGMDLGDGKKGLARGYILKDEADRVLLDAVQALSLHKPFFSSRVSEAVGTADSSDHGKSSRSRLTPREREILQLLAEGKSNKEVANLLSISVNTAEAHRANIMLKLDFHSLAELIMYAIRNNIIQT